MVTKNVPAYTVFGGTPASSIKYRHPPDLAARLKAMAWWDWDHLRLKQALPDFRSLSAEAFIDKYERIAALPVIAPLQSAG